MAQISQQEAADLVSKLLAERIPLRAFLTSFSGTRVNMPGFVDSNTFDNGLTISVSGPPVDTARGYLNFFPFSRSCECWYGETRELPAEMRPAAELTGASVLLFKLPNGESLALFFTI
jgi:hypothetical protein